MIIKSHAILMIPFYLNELSDFNVFGVLCRMLMGIKFTEDTFKRVLMVVLWRIRDARMVASISTRCGQWLWQSTHIHVKTDYALVCTETLSIGHSLRGCDHFGGWKWYGCLYQRFKFTFFATILYSRASGKCTIVTFLVFGFFNFRNFLSSILYFFFLVSQWKNRVKFIFIKFYVNWYVEILATMHGKLHVAAQIYRISRIRSSFCCMKFSKKRQQAKNPLPTHYFPAYWNLYKNFPFIYR